MPKPFMGSAIFFLFIIIYIFFKNYRSFSLYFLPIFIYSYICALFLTPSPDHFLYLDYISQYKTIYSALMDNVEANSPTCGFVYIAKLFFFGNLKIAVAFINSIFLASIISLGDLAKKNITFSYSRYFIVMITLGCFPLLIQNTVSINKDFSLILLSSFTIILIVKLIDEFSLNLTEINPTKILEKKYCFFSYFLDIILVLICLRYIINIRFYYSGIFLSTLSIFISSFILTKITKQEKYISYVIFFLVYGMITFVLYKNWESIRYGLADYLGRATITQIFELPKPTSIFVSFTYPFLGYFYSLFGIYISPFSGIKLSNFNYLFGLIDNSIFIFILFIFLSLRKKYNKEKINIHYYLVYTFILVQIGIQIWGSPNYGSLYRLRLIDSFLIIIFFISQYPIIKQTELRYFFIVNSMDFFISHRLNIAKKLISENKNVTLISSEHSKNSEKSKDILSKNCVNLIKITINKNKIKFLSIINSQLIVFKKIFLYPNSIFHVVTITPIVLFGPILRIFNIKTVYALSGLGTVFTSEKKIYRIIRNYVALLYKFLFNGKNSRVIVQNIDDFNFLINNLNISRLNVILIKGSGVDPNNYPYFHEYSSNNIVLVPARLIREKGILDILEASQILTLKGIQHEVWLAGDIDQGNPSSLNKQDLEEIKNKYKNVKILGHVENMLELYSKATIVCLPSYREGLPRALIEAAACGRVIVTCDVPGCRDIVEDGKTGILVKVNSPESLSKAIELLLNNKQLIEALRTNAYEKFLEQYTSFSVVNKTTEVYSSFEKITVS